MYLEKVRGPVRFLVPDQQPAYAIEQGCRQCDTDVQQPVCAADPLIGGSLRGIGLSTIPHRPLDRGSVEPEPAVDSIVGNAQTSSDHQPANSQAPCGFQQLMAGRRQSFRTAQVKVIGD